MPASNAAEPDLLDHRFVYNGDGGRANADAAMRLNRPVRRKRQSPFALISLFFMLSVLIVFYIWNKISVSKLALEVDDLQNQYSKIVNANEVLRAEINQKSRIDRIEQIAEEQLKMSSPKQQPVMFEIDEAQLKSAQQELHRDE